MSGGYTASSRPMPGLNIGYARVSTDQQVLALLEWRVTRTTQALQLLDLSGSRR